MENFTTEWQTQSEMTYDGLGNRLEVTTYSDGEGNTTRYVLDGGTELTAIGAENTTFYLYGMGVIGTLGESWSYMLQDGAGSTRQLVDEEGTVNLSVSYTPWGDTMEIYGSGMLNLGYLGGVYDAGTGLIYMGNGQYYDPSTGRFLTRGTQQDQSNPYTPWNSDPAGMLIAPLALLALVFGRKKTCTKFDQFIILFVIVLSVGLSVSACSASPDEHGASKISIPEEGIEIAIGDSVIKITPTPSATATNTPQDTCTPSPTATSTITSTPTPTSTIDDLFQYNVVLTGNDDFWTIERQKAVLQAVKDIADKFGKITGETPINAFTNIYHYLNFEWCNECANGYGWCYNDSTIKVDGMFITDYLNTRFIIHELGHMFDRRVCAYRDGTDGCTNVFTNSARTDLGDVWNTKYTKEGSYLSLTRSGFEMPDTGVYWGFAGGWCVWQFGATDGNGEVWADMFLAWVYDAWDDDIYGFGEAKKEYMDEKMKIYLNSMIN